MAGDIGSIPVGQTVYRLPFEPLAVPDAVPAFVRELAAVVYHLHGQPLEPITEGSLPPGITVPEMAEPVEGSWIAVRTTRGCLPDGGADVDCTSFFGPGFEEHTRIIAQGQNGAVTELERRCRPIILDADLSDEQLSALFNDTLDPAMQAIASFALSGSREVPVGLSGLEILNLDGPKITVLYRIGNNGVVYRPLDEVVGDNGSRGREFQEEIYIGIGELAPNQDPADAHTPVGMIVGQTLIKYSPGVTP